MIVADAMAVLNEREKKKQLPIWSSKPKRSGREVRDITDACVTFTTQSY